MTQVIRQNNESVERLLSRFRRKIIKKGTLKQTRKNIYFQKKMNKNMLKKKAIYREMQRAKAKAQYL